MSYHASGVYTAVGKQLAIEETIDSSDAGPTIFTDIWTTALLTTH